MGQHRDENIKTVYAAQLEQKRWKLFSVYDVCCELVFIVSEQLKKKGKFSFCSL